MPWVPPDITPVCATLHTNLTQCSPTGFMYLALVMKLFGNSSDSCNMAYVKDPPNVEDNEETQSMFERKMNIEDSKKPDKNEDVQESASNKEIDIKLYDYIIVGAGSAGCVVANRLSEDADQQILLLEAGSEEPDVAMVPAFPPVLTGSSIDWNYKTQPQETNCLAQKGQSCVCIRGKTMGGSSSTNYMVYMRGSHADYDEWEGDGNIGWNHTEVLPYFKKSENINDAEFYDAKFHGLHGPLNVERFAYVDEATRLIIKAFEDKGLPYLDLSKDSKVGVDLNLSTSKDGTRQSANIAFITPIKNKRPNLHIIINAFATKIIIDPNMKTALGIEYYKNGTFHKAFAKREVIISAGTYNSPKLLKVSGIGPKEELDKLNISVIVDSKVGYNLQDHVTTNALIIELPNNMSTRLNKEELLNEVYDYYSQNETKQGPLSTTSILNAISFIRTSKAKENLPNIQFQFDGKNMNDFLADPSSYLATNIFPLSLFDSISPSPVLLTPKSRGYIALNTTDPVFGPPLIYPGYFQDKDDLDALVEALKFAISLEETETFRKAGAKYVKTPLEGCSEYKWGTDEYLACLLTHYTGTISHPVGTCKMGPRDDENAVVAPRLRVYGVHNLRVVDGSVFPKIVRGNLNAPIMMAAEKASDMIKQDRKEISRTIV